MHAVQKLKNKVSRRKRERIEKQMKYWNVYVKNKLHAKL